jgi:hypothetical protein
MNTNKSSLQDSQVNVKLKLALLWTSLMFLIIYLDYFHLYMPSKMLEIQTGRVFIFDITPGFLLAGMISVSIPALMIFLSGALPAKINKWTNIIIASIYIPFILFNLAGEVWVHMVYGAVVEVILLSLIIFYSLKWPRLFR